MLDAYVITILTLMGIWSIVALGLNVITGLAGQFNLGIGVYMGTGAYATAMLTTARLAVIATRAATISPRFFTCSLLRRYLPRF